MVYHNSVPVNFVNHLLLNFYLIIEITMKPLIGLRISRTTFNNIKATCIL